MSTREERFAALYRREHGDVLRFVARRAGPERAEDITHDAFLVAWRRLDELPAAPGDVRAWLFAVARGCLLNERRGISRGTALAVRIAESAETFVPGHDDAVGRRVDLATAWGNLDAAQQEVLALTAWDGLTSTEAGRVLGISGPAYRVRLLRARAALRRALDAPGALALTIPPSLATSAIASTEGSR